MYSYRIEQAIRAATILHKDQVRKGSVPMPYVSHLFAVTMILGDYTKDEDVLIAALLHDTLEDTDYTSDELKADFGEKIQEYVLALTEPQDEDDKRYSWKERKQQYATQLRGAPEQSLLIAAADKIHNMRAIVEEYHNEHERFMTEYKGSLEDRVLMYQDISNAINRSLKSDIINEYNHVFDEYKEFIANVKKTKDKKEIS